MILVNNLMAGLEVLASVEHQKRIWLSPTGPEVGDFVEQVCQTFDDTGLSDYIEQNRCPSELDVRTFEALKSLDFAISEVNDEGVSPEELIRDVKMEEVRKRAKMVLELLHMKR